MKLLAIFGIFLMIAVAGCTGAQVVNPTASPQTNYNSNSQSNNPAPTVDTNAAARQAASADYSSKLSIENIERTSLNTYLQSTPTMNDQAAFRACLDSFNSKLNSYKQKCYDAITAGNTYLRYLNAGSSDYNTVKSNEQILNGNIQTYTSTYDSWSTQFNQFVSKMNTFNDYRSKIDVANAAYNGLVDYYNNAGFVSWFTGEKAKEVNARANTVVSACNSAVRAGETYKQYLTPGTTSYDGVTSLNSNLQQMSDAARGINADEQSSTELGQDILFIGKIYAALNGVPIPV